MPVTPIEKPFVSANYFGNQVGGTPTTYYYWVQAVYALGFGPLSAAAQVTAPYLDRNNVISVNWTPCVTAMYYNVWRTTTASAPTTGAGQCIAQALATADGLVDNGITAFTLAVGTPPSLLTAEEVDALVPSKKEEPTKKEEPKHHEKVPEKSSSK